MRIYLPHHLINKHPLCGSHDVWMSALKPSSAFVINKKLKFGLWELKKLKFKPINITTNNK